jgi:hypothetical protein
MRNANVFFVVSCGFALTAGCSSSSGSPSNNNASDATAENGGDTGVPSDDSSVDSASSGDSGEVTFDAATTTITCKSAADCAEGGAGQVCCFSLSTMATSCVASQCAMGDYQQCAGTSDTECPSGYQCVVSPLGIPGVYYCAMGDGGISGSDAGDAGGGGDAGDAGTVKSDGAAGDGGDGSAEKADTGTSDAAHD